MTAIFKPPFGYLSEAALRSGSISSADFSPASEDIYADGLSSSTSIGPMNDDCEKYQGKVFFRGMGFLSNGRYLSQINDGNIASFKPGCQPPGGPGDVLGTTLLPSTDRKILTVVVSPDGSRVAFIAARGDIAALYSVSSTGGEPTKVTDLGGPRVMLAGWR